MVSRNRTTGLEVKSIVYPVQQREGGSEHHVRVDPVDRALSCTCKAGENGRLCWAQKNVIAGLAGKPIVRVKQHPAPAPLPPFTRARTSPEGLEVASMLDV